MGNHWIYGAMKNYLVFRLFPKPAACIRFGVFLLLAVLVGESWASGQDPFEELTEKRSSLSRVLDSLQVEKQLRKREGRPIDRLDARTAALRDSMEAVRRRLAALNAIRDHGESDSEGSVPSTFLSWRPGTAFDWVIIAVAATAAGSGILLLFGILASLRQANYRRKKTVSRSAPKPATEEIHKKKPVSAVENEYVGVPSADSEEVDSIRLRIARDTGRFTAVSEQSTSAFSSTSSPKTTRARIVACLRQGKSVQQTARELQVSVDQVNLVSRIVDSDPT